MTTDDGNAHIDETAIVRMNDVVNGDGIIEILDRVCH